MLIYISEMTLLINFVSVYNIFSKKFVYKFRQWIDHQTPSSLTRRKGKLIIIIVFMQKYRKKKLYEIPFFLRYDIES